MTGVDVDAAVSVARRHVANLAIGDHRAPPLALLAPANVDLIASALVEISRRRPEADPGSLRESQVTLPWTIRYSRDFRANPQPHKDFAHAVVHVVKAVGKLAALVDDMDHDRDVADSPTLRADHAKYVADLVVCALRMANTFPGGAVDLQAAVEERIRTKNAVPTVSSP